MRIHRPAAELLGEIEQVLSPASGVNARARLHAAIDLLIRGRHYTWMAVYVAAGPETQRMLDADGQSHPARLAGPFTKSKILVSIRLGGHEFGLLDVESDRPTAFGPADRVLLENAARLLARFLSGPGRVITRSARACAPLDTSAG